MCKMDCGTQALIEDTDLRRIAHLCTFYAIYNIYTLCASCHLKALRFVISWSRAELEPQFNESVWQTKRPLQDLIEQSITFRVINDPQ